MKKLLIGAFALLVGLTAFGQNRGNMTPQERADKLTEKMKAQLELTDAQVKQVAPLNLEMTTAMADVDGNDPSAQEKRETIKEDYQEKLEKVLTPEQAKKAKEMGEKKRQMKKKKNW